LYKKTAIILTLLLSHITLAQQLIIGADEWEGYTNKDGTGIYFELLKKIFPQHELHFKTAPLDKIISELEENTLSIAVGLYKDDAKKAMFPQWFIDTEYPVVAIYNKKKTNISHFSDLSNLKLSWIKGYHFERYISSSEKNTLLNNIDIAFEHLANNKIDAFLDYPYNLTEEENKIYSTIEVVPTRHLYAAFQHNKNGQKLAKQFDEQMAKLRTDGTLQAMYNDEYSHTELATVKIKKKKIKIFTNSVSLLAPNNQIYSLSDSKVAQSLHFVFDRLDDYQFEFQMIEDISKIYLYTNEDNTCFTDLIITPERQEHFVASNPLSLFLGLRLYSNQALNIEGQAKLDQFFRANPNLQLGSAKGRSYGQVIDEKLESIHRQQLIQSPVSLPTLFKQLKKQRFDMVIEYPSLKQVYSPNNSANQLFSYDIDGADNYVLGHMMCNKGELGEQFIQRFNKALDELKRSASFFNAQYKRIPVESRQEFTSYFKKIFH